MLLKVGVAVAVSVLLIGVLAPMAVSVMVPDREAPAAVERLLPEAKRWLSSQLDLGVSAIRYVGVETRDSDDLVILMFELRPFPYITVDGAYLASRCVPLEDLDLMGMSGGRGVTDFASDPEIEYLRSGAQSACP
jgi:hypothetical protein